MSRAAVGTIVAAPLLAAALAVTQSRRADARTPAGCDENNAGLTLPAGFCATLFAQVQGNPRHLLVAPNGDVFATMAGSRSRADAVVALRDTNADGHADVEASFGTRGGTGIALYNGFMYVDVRNAIVRWPMSPGSMTPAGAVDTVVAGLPTGGHSSRVIAIDPRTGEMYVGVGSRTNSCQTKDRANESRGADPCVELETRAGIWRYDARRTGQRFSPAERFATGIRNAVGLTVVDGQLWATQHGRDQLAQNWGKFFDEAFGAENPAEVLLRVRKGDDFGWPYCFHVTARKALVLAPEYGGNGTAVGRCRKKSMPVAFFPGHWAPEALLFYNGKSFPERYRRGAFISFHGSWNRAPLPQAGYKVVFVPLRGTKAGAYETFADGFAGGVFDPDKAPHRPMGLAQGPDGALYISDDQGGSIWRVTYAGGSSRR